MPLYTIVHNCFSPETTLKRMSLNGGRNWDDVLSARDRPRKCLKVSNPKFDSVLSADAGIFNDGYDNRRYFWCNGET